MGVGRKGGRDDAELDFKEWKVSISTVVVVNCTENISQPETDPDGIISSRMSPNCELLYYFRYPSSLA